MDKHIHSIRQSKQILIKIEFIAWGVNRIHVGLVMECGFPRGHVPQSIYPNVFKRTIFTTMGKPQCNCVVAT